MKELLPDMTVNTRPRPLVPHLSVLEAKLGDLMKKRDRAGRDRGMLHWQVVALPYCLRAAWGSIRRFVELQQTMVVSINEETASQRMARKFVPRWREAYPIYLAVDDFLEYMRRAQNALAFLLKITIDLVGSGKTELPASMHRLMDGVTKGRYQFPEALSAVLLDYWREHGAEIKAHRDYVEHPGHAGIIADYILVSEQPDGSRTVSIRLPSKPRANRVRPVSFQPEVHAQPFLLEQFAALVKVTNAVTRSLVIALPGEDNIGVFGFVGGRGSLNRDEGYVAMNPSELDSYYDNLVRQCARPTSLRLTLDAPD